ncbi:unnamed protein product [Cylicocyclus nassatus]|uniref:UBA domain-containing protein n=1 Tax=Cylicocyclus nassatus TaxID=53992 RepID=A0AA36GR77_CYLNA|nr:unnamed protein product [Cylicocyclus nassatus]
MVSSHLITYKIFMNFTLQLSTAKDIAVLITVPVGKSGKITASARIDGKFTSEVDKKIFLPIDMKFTLLLRITQFVVEIYYNDEHVLDFVHRVSPLDVKDVHIEGPLIVEEVVFTPPQGSTLDPLPSYEQATRMGSDPITEFRHLDIGPPESSLTPTPAPIANASSSNLMAPTPPPITTSPNINQPNRGPSPFVPPSPNFFAASSSRENPGFPGGSTPSGLQKHEKGPAMVPTAFQLAQYGNTPSQQLPYVTSPTPTPTPAPGGSIPPNMPTLQPTAFQTQPLPTSYPSSSQAMQPIPSMGPQPNTPYPQIMPQVNQGYPTPMPYGFQQYPVGATNPQGVPMHPHYNPYQQSYPYAVPPGSYVTGYPQQVYPGHPAMYGRCQGNDAEQAGSQTNDSSDQQQSSQQNVSDGNQKHINLARTESFIKSVSSDEATIQLIMWLEMMEVVMQNLQKHPDGFHLAFEQNPSAENQQHIEQIRERLPRFVDIMRSPEFVAAVKNPRVLAAMRRIQLEMQVIHREAPNLGEMLCGRGSGEPTNAQQREVVAPRPSSPTPHRPRSPPPPPPATDDASKVNDRARVQYRRELEQLAKMGFLSEADGIAALRASDGNLERAVDHLLSQG